MVSSNSSQTGHNFDQMQLWFADKVEERGLGDVSVLILSSQVPSLTINIDNKETTNMGNNGFSIFF